MTDVEEQSGSRLFVVLRYICIGLLLLVQVEHISNGRPWFVTGIALFFACTLIAPYVCIDLILARLGSGISIKKLREGVFYYLFFTLITISRAMDFIQKFPSVERHDAVWLLVFLFFSALFTWMIISTAFQVLKTNKSLFPISNQPIEPSVESSPPIVP